MLAEIFGIDGVVLLVVVAAVLFGSSRIPKLARSLGSAQAEFKKGQVHGDSEASAAPMAAPAPVATAPVTVAPTAVPPAVTPAPVMTAPVPVTATPGAVPTALVQPTGGTDPTVPTQAG